MSPKRRLLLATVLMLVGGVLSAGWAVISLLRFFDAAPEGSRLFDALAAFGPLSIVLVILGGTLCRWNLPALRREVRGEE